MKKRSRWSGCRATPLTMISSSRRPQGAVQTITTGSAPLLKVRPLLGHCIKRGVHCLDQVALHSRDLVVGSVEQDDDFDCAVVRGVIEEHARRRVSEHTRMGFD